mgnify:CR=1 FL=1
MGLTRKDFEEVAEILDSNLNQGQLEKGDASVRDSLIKDFADYFESQNSNFSRPRFLEACGVAKQEGELA